LGESPFLLSFSCKIPEKYGSNEIDNAIDFVFDRYPHLTYVIGNDKNQKHWEKCALFRDFIKIPLEEDSLKKGEPLLRIFREEDDLMVQWHHILLDAVGISMLMQAFYITLIGEQKIIERNYKVLLNQESIRNIAKTVSSSKECKVFERVLTKTEKESLEQIIKNFELSLQDCFLLLSHSIFGNESLVAYTDNALQCGLPGMFTLLNCSRFLNSKNIKSSLQKNADSNKTMLQFICEADNPLSVDKAKQLFTNIDKLLDEKSFESLFNEKSKEIHFEDFDF
jgi:hypothetical protein